LNYRIGCSLPEAVILVAVVTFDLAKDQAHEDKPKTTPPYRAPISMTAGIDSILKIQRKGRKSSGETPRTTTIVCSGGRAENAK
jgi:hypothetical protein